MMKMKFRRPSLSLIFMPGPADPQNKTHGAVGGGVFNLCETVKFDVFGHQEQSHNEKHGTGAISHMCKYISRIDF